MKKTLAIAMVFLATVTAISTLTFEAKSDPVPVYELKQLIVAPYYDDSPSLFQDSTGKIWVFYGSKNLSYPYSRKGIFYITSTDMGKNWSDSIEFMPAHEDGPEEYPYPNWPCAFEDSTGKIWVAWQRWTTAGQSDIYYATSTDGGVTWSNGEVLVAHPGDDNTGCFVEVGGQIWHIFCPYYLSSWDVHYKIWLEDHWSDPYRITDDLEPHHFGASAIVDSTGTVWVTYERGYGGGSGDENIWVKNSSDNGATWSNGTQITLTAGSENRPRILEYSGTIYVFYYTGEQPVQDIWCVTSLDNGSTWSTPQQMTTDPDIDCHAWPSQIDTQLWFAWSTKRSGDYDIWLAKPEVVSAHVDFDPNILNLKRKGTWVTAFIELPEGYNVSDINVSTISLNGTIPVDVDAPTAIGDYDIDGVPDLMVKFNRTTVSRLILDKGITYGNVTLSVAGQLADGTLFEGSDVIKVKMPGDVNGDGKVDICDIVLAVKAYRSYPGHPRWNPMADENEDNKIGIVDIIIIAIHFGKTY